MPAKISVIINTFNEEKNIERAIRSIEWADEIIVCDMHSDDKTVEVARKMGAKVIFYKKVGFVEPARNFAISKASGDWILILDADEEIGKTLVERLQEIATSMRQIDYVKIPRKNIIFGHWMKASMWWPDLNVRFFKRGKVVWTNKIHRPPEVSGEGLELSADEKWAIIHHNYNSVFAFLERMMGYTKVEAEQLIKEGYRFDWKDLIKKPLSEFLGRFFANKGYTDGIHGLALSLLQAFSSLTLYLRVWELENFKDQTLEIDELKNLSKQAGNEIDYWFKHISLSKNPFKTFAQKLKTKLIQ